MPLLFIETQDIETALGMRSGYVLDFSNRTFGEFIASSIGIDIYSGLYSYRGTSKANHLRCFFEKGPDNLIGRLLMDLIVYARQMKESDRSSKLTEIELRRLDRCEAIAARLKVTLPVENIESLQPNDQDDRDFAVLAKAIREGIERHEAGPVLDRLHTFCVKYFRTICHRRHIDFNRSDNLGSLVAKYVRDIEQNGLLEAEVTLKIMKSSISNFGEFNYIRNNKSLAHDNKTLNEHEAMLLFNYVSSTIRFIDTLESKTETLANAETSPDLDSDMPF